jgi:hypothetical protein
VNAAGRQRCRFARFTSASPAKTANGVPQAGWSITLASESATTIVLEQRTQVNAILAKLTVDELRALARTPLKPVENFENPS